MRWLGLLLIACGVLTTIIYSYQHWTGLQSVTKLTNDVVKKEHAEVANLTYYSEDKTINERKKNVRLIEGEKIAQLVLPSIDLAFDVYWGTNETSLAKGVGMYDSKWTTTPNEGGHTLLSGHRDTVFRPVGDLNIGDFIYINYDGLDYEYEVFDIWITDKDDRTVIVEKSEPTLTLSTCYPFYFIGNAPDRYIIQAKLINKGDLLNL